MELPTNSELHAILVHFPIALAIAGVPLVLISGFAAAGRAVRWVGVGLYGVVAASAYAAFWSGERARDLIPNTYPQEIWDTLETHEALAASVWIGALVTAVFLGIGAFHYKWIRVPSTTIAFVASVVTAILVGTTGHFGGQLVYKHAVGTPGAAALYGSPVGPSPHAGGGEPVSSQPTSALGEGLAGVDVTAQPNTASLSASLDVPTVGAIAPSPEATAQGFPVVRPIDMSEAEAVSYFRDVAPLMETHCNECHYEFEAEGDLILTSVDAMLQGGQKSGASIIPGDPDNSPLILYIRGVLKPQMPKRRDPLSEEEVHVLRMWIQAGAVDDSSEAAAN